EGAFEHAIGREVLTELLLVEREAFAPELLGEIGYVPRFEDVGTSASARELGELAVLSFERRARLLGEVVDEAPRCRASLRHAIFGDEIREAREAEQRGFLAPELEDARHDGRVVVGASRTARVVRAVDGFAQGAV